MSLIIYKCLHTLPINSSDCDALQIGRLYMTTIQKECEHSNLSLCFSITMQGSSAKPLHSF